MTDKTTSVMIPKKKEYARPALTEFGGVARLSQSGATAGTENGGMPTNNMAPCL
jgi:hypothetical protein